MEELKNHLINFLASGSGGPERYTGRDMPTAHKGMNISEAEYMAAMDDIMKILKQHEIKEGAQQEVLTITYSLKDQIARL